MAAGKGERLKGITHSLPKALVQVAGKTLLEYAINRFVKAGVQNIIIAVGWKSNLIKDAVPQFESTTEIKIIDVSNYEIGPLQTLATALEATQNEESIVCPVDLLISSDSISEIVSHHTEIQDTLVTLAVDTQSASGSTVSLDSHGHVLGVQREIDSADSLAKSAMFMVISSQFLEYCKKALSGGATTAVSVLNHVIEEKRLVKSYSVNERWFDIDTLADVLEANRYLLESSAVQFEKAVFIPSGDIVDIGENLHLRSEIKVGNGVTLKGPCLIQSGSIIGSNCIIGPHACVGFGTLIGDECEIKNAVISGQSKVPDHSKLSDILMSRSEIFRME
ncbi:MAG: NTP transferase domain-containing protein [Candidatus Thorarchaeota archaeon]